MNLTQQRPINDATSEREMFVVRSVRRERPTKNVHNCIIYNNVRMLII